MTCNAVCSAGCGGACTDGCGIACQNTCGISCAGNCLQSCSDYCSATCTGNCSNSCSTSCNSLAGAGVTGAGLNLVRNGTLSSFGQGLVNWDSVWTLSALNDGNKAVVAMQSSGGAAASNNGRGVTVGFNRPVSLKRFVIVCQPRIFNHAVDYYNGSTWVRIATIASGSTNGGVLDFNLTGSVTASLWRWYIEAWADSNYFYGYEVECYDYIPATTGIVTLS